MDYIRLLDIRAMKKLNEIGSLTVLVFGMILMSGCISPGSMSMSPAATTAPQIVNGTVLVTSSPATIAAPAARYTVGDIVWRNDSNYDPVLHISRGIIIVRVDAQSYTYEHISKNDGDTLWSRVYPDEKINDIVSFEESYPRKVDHVLSITNQYPSRAAYEKILTDESCNSSLICPI
jgi:hypothetical protein